MAQVESKGIVITLSLEEAIALCALLGNMSRNKMKQVANVDDEQSQLLGELYGVLSAFLPDESAN